jgi:hypothetical protein
VKLRLFPIYLALIFILIFSFQVTGNAQLKVSVGGFIGGGTVKGNSPSIASFTTSLFVETNMVLFLEVFPRLSFIFAKDFNAIIPNVKKPYFPYVRAISFKGVTTQYFKSNFFLEEGAGLLAINDRTFNDTDLWAYGVVISLNGGFDLRAFDLDGFKIGAGAEFGFTFNNTLPRYSSLHLFFHYTF